MIEPNWDHYRSLLAVLRHGSLSAAARELGLTQPTLGRHIEALEMALRQPLFTRSQQGLLPTERAIALAPFAETLAATSAALLRAAAEDAGRVSGTVRISASEVIGSEVLPRILADLHCRHPDLTIELSATDTVEDMLRREADVAIRMTSPSQDALMSRKIGGIPIGLYAHREYLRHHGTVERVEDLDSHFIIAFDRQTAFIRSMSTLFAPFRHMRASLRTDSNLAQLSAIRAGLGLGFCQIGLAMDDPNLVRILPETAEYHLETWVVMHEDMKASPRCRATFDALVEGLRAYVAKTAPNA